MTNNKERHQGQSYFDEGLHFRSSTRNLLLLPEYMKINDEDMANVIAKNRFFNKLYAIEEDIQPILATLEKTGVLISKNWFDQGIDFKREKMLTAKTALKAYMPFQGDDDMNSHIHVYWHKHNLRVVKTFEDLDAYKHIHPTYKLMRDYEKNKRYVNQWGTKLMVKGEDLGDKLILRGRWLSFSSYTGRITARNSALTSIPNVMKNYVVPPEGYEIVSFDISSAELRVLAYYSHCTRMLEKLTSGADIHSEMGSLIQTIVDSDEKLEAGIARNVSKTFSYSLLYGGSLNSLKLKLSKILPTLSIQDVINIQDMYYELYPEMFNYLDERMNSELLHTFYGYIRPIKNFTKNQKRNYSLQSSVAVILKQLMILISKRFQIYHVIHDEIWILIRLTEDIDATVTRIVSEAQSLLQSIKPGFPVNNLLTVKKIGGIA